MKKRPFLSALVFSAITCAAQNVGLNADFESSSAGTVTTASQTQGWTVTATKHPSVSPGGNTCNLLNYSNWNSPALSAVKTRAVPVALLFQL